jgi:hypothetical protein
VALAAVVIAIVGWQVNLRDQERLFIHQVKNEARKEIVAAVRKHQDAITVVNTTLKACELTGHQSIEHWSDHELKTVSEQLASGHREIQSRKWLLVLEQYELLFPATKRARGELAVYGRLGCDMLSDIVLRFDGSRVTAATFYKSADTIQRLTDESLLLEDLLVYVQNETLSDIVEREVASGRPASKRDSPRFALKDGALTLIDAAGNRVFSDRQKDGSTT